VTDARGGLIPIPRSEDLNALSREYAHTRRPAGALPAKDLLPSRRTVRILQRKIGDRLKRDKGAKTRLDVALIVREAAARAEIAAYRTSGSNPKAAPQRGDGR